MYEHIGSFSNDGIANSIQPLIPELHTNKGTMIPFGGNNHIKEHLLHKALLVTSIKIVELTFQTVFLSKETEMSFYVVQHPICLYDP